MNDRERKTRPRLDRERPIRSFSSAFGAPEVDRTRRGEDPSGGDGVGRAVDLGYQVVDEYIRQGQRAARRMTDATVNPRAYAGDLEEMGRRMMQFAEQWMALWAELAQGMTGAASARGAAPAGESLLGSSGPSASTATSGRPGGADRGEDAARVRVEVSASGPHQVSLDLRPAAAGEELLLHPLRGADPASPPIEDVAYAQSDEGSPASLRVRIPKGQPAGVYVGVILAKRTHRPVGTLTVQIPE